MKLKVITGIVLLLVAAFFSLSLPNVSAPAILVTPIDTTITVTSNETFTLVFKMKFNETDLGYFGSVTFYWDNDETDPNAPYWNFTYEGFKCWFTDGTNFSVSIVDNINKAVPYGYPLGYYRYVVQIRETDGEPYNGDFWVNVTMRAAGVKNSVYYPHAKGDQNITISMVRCYEASMTSVGPGNCTVHVTAPLPPVGGNITPINKLELLIPYIGVASVILVTITVVVKKRRLNYTEG